MGWQPETQPKGKPLVEKTKGAETMQRLIDANALRDKLQKEIDKASPPFNDVIGSIRCGVRLARNIVEDEPTIDAEPVRHAKWIESDEYDEFSGRLYRCSNCNTFVIGDIDNYCPFCGARMEADNDSD